MLSQVKMHWVHENYWQPGPQGNDIQKTNVPNLRMRFRYDNHQEEVCPQSRPGDDEAEASTQCQGLAVSHLCLPAWLHGLVSELEAPSLRESRIPPM